MGFCCGESTRLPIRIQKAFFDVSVAKPLAQYLIRLDLTVMNDVVPESVTAKLRMLLPLGASVCTFECLRDGQWYPANSIEASTANEVVYEAGEEGRHVITSQTSGTVFEIDVHPLPYQAPTLCRLRYSHSDVTVPFQFQPETQVEIAGGRPLQTFAALPLPSEPGACVGDCFGDRHFACFIPFEVGATTTEPLQRIALLWDVSGSQANIDHRRRFVRLRALASLCPDVKFDVWTFGVYSCREREAVGVDEAIGALATVMYDGGTDLTLLSELLTQVGPGIGAALLFSDGVDSLGRQPLLQEDCPPLHCVVDVHTADLETLGRLSLRTGGYLLKREYSRILQPQVVLTRIRISQRDEAFCEAENGFHSCPDCRGQIKHPINEDGLWICGTQGSVQKITAEVRVGSRIVEHHFDLLSAPILEDGSAHLLGYLFARQQCNAVFRDGADPVQMRAHFATRYGVCSIASTPDLRYKPAALTTSMIQCPDDSQAHAAWDASPTSDAPHRLEGGLGQPNAQTQARRVAKLATLLEEFAASLIPKDSERKQLSGASVSMRAVATLAPSIEAVTSSEEAVVDRSTDSTLCFDYESVLSAACCAPRARARAPKSRIAMSAACAAPGLHLEMDRASRSRAHSSESCSLLGAGRACKDELRRETQASAEGRELTCLEVVASALREGSWAEVYFQLRREHGSSPSFFIQTAGLLLDKWPSECQAAVRICTNCLELDVRDVQMMRSVGYFLLETNHHALALAVLDHIGTFAPAQPQSFLDRAFAGAKEYIDGRACEEKLRSAIDSIAHVLTHVWADDFESVELSALVLLHVLVVIGAKTGLSDLWPLFLTRDLQIPTFNPVLVLWLDWDADNTDIHLHVVEPSGHEVSLSNPCSTIRGHPPQNFRQSYGPEMYFLQDPEPGKYLVKAKHCSSQLGRPTVRTSVVIWAFQGGPTPCLRFQTARLDQDKEMMDVMMVTVQPTHPPQHSSAAQTEVCPSEKGDRQ